MIILHIILLQIYVKGVSHFLMGKQDNMKEKILKTPTASDINPDRLKSFLIYYGFVLKKVRGSHHIYTYDGKVAFCIPMHNPVLPTYIDQIRNKIIEIEEEK